ncbi:hypothetical protein [Streptosporangium sp. NPDC002524]|uniref:hypothetical protein n=1 Tax=Streptosporangium sp. NPDC002524 TaxID=3154537 RepID=UPI00332973E4
MTITESELREILNGDGDGDGREGHNRGVTVADVHRRVRAIRRRRWTTAGAVAAVLVAAVALNTSAGGVADDLDIWTGVMARPSPTIPTTSRPLGEPHPLREIASGNYRTGGTREELQIGSGNNSLGVNVYCSGPLRRVIVWVGDGPPRRQLCGTGPDGYPMVIRETQGADHLTGGRTVSAAVLPGEIDAAGRTGGELAEGMAGFFEGWEERLAEAEPFPLKWSVVVREVIYPVCRDNIRQLDPRTGEMVRLSCGGQGATPPGNP